VRFQVLTAESMKFFWDVLPCKIIVDRRFRGMYFHHHLKTILNFISDLFICIYSYMNTNISANTASQNKLNYKANLIHPQIKDALTKQKKLWAQFVFLWHYNPYSSLVLLCTEVSYSHEIRQMVGPPSANDHSAVQASTYTGQHNM
jgi:hypothetical protein